MKRAVYRVQFVGGEWHVGGPDVPKPLHWLRTSDQAIEVARLLCRLAHGRGRRAQLVLHGKNGKIRWERTYGADPVRTPLRS